MPSGARRHTVATCWNDCVEPDLSGTPMSASPDWLQTLIGRYDPSVFEEPGRAVRVRLVAPEDGAWEVVLAEGAAKVGSPDGRPQAVITADTETWDSIAAEPRAAINAYVAGRLAVRNNLHAGVGFLAATSGASGHTRLRFRSVATRRARLSMIEAGEGPPVLAVHGLGATKGSFVPTIDALSNRFRTIALDLPGFGDSSKPIGAAYDARFFATACIDLLDALELDRVHLIGNSLGGRVALEIGLRHPERVGRLALLAPALAWRRPRPWAPLLRLTRPELGLVQLAPRAMVDVIVRQLVPGANQGWRAAGVDEFLRAYLTPAGRAAFYATARHIYLDEPHGRDGFWPRLATLQAEALFVWGQRDQLVPIGFARHVANAVPHASHLELDCGHVPQVERPALTNSAIATFFSRAKAEAA
jgi:pimeloyl-ACP methyl ester carboxylesterase